MTVSNGRENAAFYGYGVLYIICSFRQSGCGQLGYLQNRIEESAVDHTDQGIFPVREIADGKALIEVSIFL